MRKKICSILILAMLLLNSSLMMIISSAIDVVEDKISQQEVETITESTISKYVNYAMGTDENKEKGVLLQLNLKSGINFLNQENYKPIDTTEIKLEVPKINNVLPRDVNVIVKTTKATNGGREADYVYNNNDGIITITIKNEGYTEKDLTARDEFEIILEYNENAYTENKDEREIKYNISIKQLLKNEEKTEIKNQKEFKQIVTEDVGSIISIEQVTSDIYNGYIKENYTKVINKQEPTKETKYTEQSNVMISQSNIMNNIIINEKTIFVNENNEEQINNNIIYKNIIFNKNNIFQIISEDGSIEIITNNDEKKTINKDTETDENGNINIVFEKEVNDITFKINNLNKEGILNITKEKIIKPTQTNEKEKIKTKSEIVGEKISEENNDKITKEIYKINIDNYEEIKESVSNVDVMLDKTTLVNNIVNDVKVTATLRADNVQYSLFKNPIINIEFPNEIENITIEDIKLMYNTKFSIVDYIVNTNENGNKVLQVKLLGEETEYRENDLSKGTNIVISTKVNLKKDIENTNTFVKVTYENDNTQEKIYSNSEEQYEKINISLNNKTIINSPISDEDVTNNVINNYTNEDVKIEIETITGNKNIGENDFIFE